MSSTLTPAVQAEVLATLDEIRKKLEELHARLDEAGVAPRDEGEEA
jgi:hypothetical protein